MHKVRRYVHETGILQFWAIQGGLRTYKVSGPDASTIVIH